MLARTSYGNSFYTSLNQGGVSNSFIISKLTFNDKDSACGLFNGPRAEVFSVYHPISKKQ